MEPDKLCPDKLCPDVYLTLAIPLIINVIVVVLNSVHACCHNYCRMFSV